METYTVNFTNIDTNYRKLDYFLFHTKVYSYYVVKIKYREQYNYTFYIETNEGVKEKSPFHYLKYFIGQNINIGLESYKTFI